MDLGKTPTFNRLSTKITVSPRVDMVFVLYYVDFLGILHECVLSPTYVLFRQIYYQRHPMLPELKVSFVSQTMFPHQGGSRGWSIRVDTPSVTLAIQLIHTTEAGVRR